MNTPPVAMFHRGVSPAYFPFQEEGIVFALERGAALIADAMGLGKTAQAIGVINADPSIRNVIVVCPASVRIPWRRELEKWLDRPFSIGVVGVDRQSPQESGITVINYDRLCRFTSELSARIYDLAILDECHYIKSPDSKRTRAALSIKARRRIALSGTPLLNRPIELYPALSWLDPQSWPVNGYFLFGQRYCGAKHNGFGWDLSGASNLQELSTHLRSTVMIRRTKAEVLPQLPPKIRTVIELYPTVGMKRLLKHEMDLYEARYMKVNHSSINRDDLARLRHQTALSKVPLETEYVTEVLDGGVEKLVLFAHHRDVIAELEEALSKFKPVTLIGGTSPQDRQRAIDAFQTNPGVRLFIGNIQAAGTGITLTASSRCIFAELSWVPAELGQCEDRLHRIGTSDSVTVQHLVLEGSLDAMMVHVLLKKQKILDAVLEEDTSHKMGPATLWRRPAPLSIREEIPSAGESKSRFYHPVLFCPC
jgi:SWI/SNF-related matrix-associated actin-dependent regulator of chromatin subfamily A-like protein 1